MELGMLHELSIVEKFARVFVHDLEVLMNLILNVGDMSCEALQCFGWFGYTGHALLGYVW